MAALRRRLAAITQAHKLKGIAWTPDPRVRRTLRGILRQHGTASRKAAALTTAEIRKLVATCEVAGECHQQGQHQITLFIRISLVILTKYRLSNMWSSYGHPPHHH
jgi:hypothetical protein